jgi:hypothetical protein
MALERFIPKSPDIFIRNSQDFEVAKFGHLNTIVEYINNNSAKPAGLNGYVQFNDNTALGGDAGLFWDNVNKRLGIGTVTPTSLLDIVRYTTGSVNNNYQMRILNSADGLYPYTVLLLEHNNRTGVGNQGGASIVIKDGFANVARAGLGFDYFNSGSYTNAGGTLRLSNDGQGNLILATGGVDAVRVFKDQGVQIGSISTNLSSIARLLVKGSGSTSATTSLLVQNSAGNNSFEVKDDRSAIFSAGLTTSGILSFANIDIQAGLKVLTTVGIGGYNAAKDGTTVDIYGSQTTASSFGGAQSLWINNTLLANNNNYNLIGLRINPTFDHSTFVNTVDYGIQFNSTFAFSTGTNNATNFILNPTYNYTGGTNTVRGIYYNPTLTSLTGTTHIALQTVTGDVIFGSTSGNVGIGATGPTARLQVKGSGSTGATSSLLVQNSGGVTALEIFDSLTVRSDNSNLFFSNTTAQHRLGLMTFTNNSISCLSVLNIGGNTATTFTNATLSFQTSTTFNALGAPNNATRSGISIVGDFTNPGAGIISVGNNFNITTALNTSVGTVTLNQFNITNTVNTTGGTTLQRGFYYNPTLTGTVGFTHYAIQTTSGGAYINTATPAATAALQVDSTTQGFLPPRMTTAQRLAIASPAASLIVFDTDVQNLCYRRDGVWVQATFAAV